MTNLYEPPEICGLNCLVQELVQELHSETLAVWVNINNNKSKVVLSNQAVIQPFSLGNQILDRLDEYKHLEQVFRAGSGIAKKKN